MSLGNKDVLKVSTSLLISVLLTLILVMLLNVSTVKYFTIKRLRNVMRLIINISIL